MNKKERCGAPRRFLRFLSLLLAAALLPVIGASSRAAENVVRIGWFESPFNMMDDLGRRSGYAYEYAQKIAVYSNWKYEYVEGSWPELLQMLQEGKIDLLSDVSYKTEREESMFFSQYPMGSEEYYLFTTPDNKDISTDDYSTFNGKKVGANKGSVQIDYFRDWAKANNVDAELVELSGTEAKNIAKLIRGDIDMYLTLDTIADPESTIPVCKIASSDFYFAVSKQRPDLLAELNSAMGRVQEDNRFYNQQLYMKYLKPIGFNKSFKAHELEWLSEHSVIRIGYQDNYLAFCAQDPKTGKLIGALKDYLETATYSMDNARPKFEPVAYPTAEAALEALKNGEIDCMFPVNFSDYYGEADGYSITSALMNTDMLAIIAESDQDTFLKKEHITVAVNAGNPNYDIFLLDHFPEWRSVYYHDTGECLRAVAKGTADCVLISSFRYNDLADECGKYHLVSVPTGVKMDYSLAVSRENTVLYSILNRIICVVPDTTMSVALSRYALEDAKSGFFEYIRQNRKVIAAVTVPLALFVLILLFNYLRSLKKSRDRKRLIRATETDGLTGLYNKNYFFEYANRMYAANKSARRDAIVVNIIQFHSLNAIQGRDFGDKVLRALGEALSAFCKENGGIAGRAEADRFAVYCSSLQDYHVLLDRLQAKLDSQSSHTTIRLRMGVMPWEKDTEPQQMIEQAMIACNMARGHYKERLIVFDDQMRRREGFEQQLLNDLRRAVDQNEFKVFYHPKFDIQKPTPQLHSAEALVRWIHPKYGKIAPADFIPLFERSGQIGVIDHYVWRKAAEQVAQWKQKFGRVIPVSINLSRVDLFDPTLEETLDALLRENGLDRGALQLEVTESAYTENADAFIEIIKSLRQKGYRVEMDDFGTGYSSLNMLSSLPIDALKMDRAFLYDIEFNPKQVQMIRLILNIAVELQIPVIAEGVETEAQLRLLRDFGCAYAQGHYFSKPLPAASFEQEVIEKHLNA